MSEAPLSEAVPSPRNILSPPPVSPEATSAAAAASPHTWSRVRVSVHASGPGVVPPHLVRVSHDTHLQEQGGSDTCISWDLNSRAGAR